MVFPSVTICPQGLDIDNYIISLFNHPDFTETQVFKDARAKLEKLMIRGKIYNDYDSDSSVVRYRDWNPFPRRALR